MKKNINIILIKILKLITLFILGYLTIWIMLNMLNDDPFYKLLDKINIYRAYYKFINIFNPTILFLLIGTMIISIPYLITSIYLGIVILVKYIKKKRKLTKIMLLSFSLIVILCITVKFFPLTGRYIIKVNSKVNMIQNTEIKKFVEANIRNNPYITYIEINRGFPDDYNVKIHYFNILFKTEEAFLSDGDYSFVHDNSINVTNINTIISIIFLITNMIVYRYFCKYLIEDYKEMIESKKENT